MKQTIKALAFALAAATLLCCAACGKAPADTRASWDQEMFALDQTAKISSEQFLLVEKNMTMRQVMDTLGETAHTIGQGSGTMYYIVDGMPLKIDFEDFLSDLYPYTGQEMKMYWDIFGAVTFKTIQADDLLRLRKGMTYEDIIKALGKTIDIGSGRSIIMYTIWDGMSLREFAFNSGNEGLPWTGKEIYDMFINGETGIFW